MPSPDISSIFFSSPSSFFFASGYFAGFFVFAAGGSLRFVKGFRGARPRLVGFTMVSDG
jgi:hypothetical protein